MFKSVKGTKDILPSESALWQYVEKIAREVFHRFNYKEIRTPIFEHTGLFSRSIGELTDIVGKEMYTFLDRSEESVTLKPEGTASVIRSYIQHNLTEEQPLVKVYYISPMFRQERPQAGRLRQFHQFGAEAIGASTPETDVEIIALIVEMYRSFSLNNFSVKINSVGCENCRPQYKTLLQNELRKISSQLSPESQNRIEKNPLRVLDSKNEKDRELTENVPLIYNYLCENCHQHFEKLKSILTHLTISYQIDGRLVRGLDYYTKTAFEITSNELGSQDALAGGGRYDLLVQELGGKPTPSVGFAAGIERLIMILEKKQDIQIPKTHPKLFIAAADDNSREYVFQKTMELRRKEISVEMDFLQRSLKAQMREANRQQAEYVLVIGIQERETQKGKIKNLSDGSEKEIDLTKIEI